jgi:cyclopropane fatty-acyl-phospholipid synthase-like methyltransferase
MVGKHYARTCEDWLQLLLKNQKQAKEGLKETYGDKAEVWYNRWIVFFLVKPWFNSTANSQSCAELFAYNNGDEWFVGHYLFSKK